MIISKKEILRVKYMKLEKLIKRIVKLGFWIISYATICSSIEAKKQYEEIGRENIILFRKMADLEDRFERHIVSNKKIEEEGSQGDEIICATIKKTNSADEISHTVQEYNGFIGVFDGDGVLIKQIDIEVSSLPESDREDLSVGIRVYSSDELEKLIEQFK